jgi:hypothetical protein
MGGWWHRTCRRIHFFYEKGNQNHEFGTGFFVHKRIISAVKRVEVTTLGGTLSPQMARPTAADGGTASRYEQ